MLVASKGGGSSRDCTVSVPREDGDMSGADGSEDGAFYIVTYALSNKIKQIEVPVPTSVSIAVGNRGAEARK